MFGLLTATLKQEGCMSTTWPDSAVMITLSAIAYQSDVAGQLKNTEYATGGNWSLAWGPVQNDYGNLAYVAKNLTTGAYALVIRGSEFGFSWTAFENWFYDLDVIFQIGWPYLSNAPDSAISLGSYVQAMHISTMTWNGQSLANFLMNGGPQSAMLYVTGHSLGGNLATVLASWISSLRVKDPSQPDPSTQIYTYATPSPGNEAFATAYNSRFPNSWRYVNPLDIVPKTWDHMVDVIGIYDDYFLYTPDLVEAAIYSMQGSLWSSEELYGSFYQQTNGDGTTLPTVFILPAPDWFSEVAGQHASNTYLSLLGAPPIVSSLIAGPAAKRMGITPGPVIPRPVFRRRHIRPPQGFGPRPSL
jgi:triacylglycerol lipase